MVFDDEYSDSVSLSRILDYFIEDGEKSSIILDFLSKYNTDEILDIFKNSRCVPRILCLDFANRCSETEYERILGIVKDVTKRIDRFDKDSMRMYLYFLWQLLGSGLSDSRKKLARDVLKDVPCFEKHPYRGSMGGIVSQYDSVIFNRSTNGDESLCKLCDMNIGAFKRYIDNMWHSLWSMRLMQMDIFGSLDAGKQYILASKVFSNRTTNVDFRNDIFRFYRQIMDSDIDAIMKNSINDMMLSSFPGHYVKNKIHNMVNEYSSIEEIMMMLQIFGMDDYAEDMILYFLLKDDKESLMWIHENCDNILEEYLDIRNLVEYWIGNGDNVNGQGRK